MKKQNQKVTHDYEYWASSGTLKREQGKWNQIATLMKLFKLDLPVLMQEWQVRGKYVAMFLWKFLKPRLDANW